MRDSRSVDERRAYEEGDEDGVMGCWKCERHARKRHSGLIIGALGILSGRFCRVEYVAHGRGRPQRLLTAQFSAKQILITTYYARFLLLRCRALVSNVTQVVELERTNKLAQFVDKCVQLRRQSDLQNNPSMASFSKLAVNASFGFSLLNKSKFVSTVVGTEAEFGEALVSGRFHSGLPLGGPRYKDQLFEISRRPKSVLQNTPVVLGFAVLNAAKVKLLEFYWHMTRLLRPSAWALTGGDTDSCGLFLASSNLEDLVREEMQEEWEKVKWTIFANPNDPNSKRQPGLWKIESESTSLVHLSSKLYSLFNEGNGESKTTVRGGNFQANRLLLTHNSYLVALQRPLKFQAYLRERGLVVVGPGMLKKAEEDDDDDEMEEDELGRVLSAGRRRQLWRAAGAEALAWEEAAETTRLESHNIPRPRFALALTNVSFRRDETNAMHTLRTNKTLLIACYTKRVCLGQGCITVPLPEKNDEEGE